MTYRIVESVELEKKKYREHCAKLVERCLYAVFRLTRLRIQGTATHKPFLGCLNFDPIKSFKMA